MKHMISEFNTNIHRHHKESQGRFLVIPPIPNLDEIRRILQQLANLTKTLEQKRQKGYTTYFNMTYGVAKREYYRTHRRKITLRARA